MIVFKDDPDELPWEVMEKREKAQDEYYKIASKRLRIIKWIASTILNINLRLADPPLRNFSIKDNMFDIKNGRWEKKVSHTSS